MPWVYDPHSGGSKIPVQQHKDISKQIEVYARTRPWYSKIQLTIRFKGQFCYIDTVDRDDKRIFPLCRLRHKNRGWSLALFTYSNERYAACLLSNGQWEGTMNDALKTCEPFII
jgi:hypothetical protein